MKKLTILLVVFSVILSCKAPEEEVAAIETVPIESVVVNQEDLLFSPEEIVIDPLSPLLSDTELLQNSFLSSFKFDETGEYDYSSMTINYFNPSKLDLTKLVSASSKNPLKIVDYGPSGELPIEMKRPVFFVLFNQPMVPLSRLGAPMKENPIISIEPAVEGTFRWMGTKMLSFQPDGPIHREQDYKVTINKGTTSLFGNELPGDFKYRFYNEPLEIISVTFGDDEAIHDSMWEVPPEKSGNLNLYFNQTVDAAGLKDYLSFSIDTDVWDFEIDEEVSEGRIVKVSIPESMPFKKEVHITLIAGARANDKSSELEESQEMIYHTLSPFVYVDHDSYSYSFPYDPEGGRNPLFLEFSHPVDKESILGNLSTSFEGLDLTDHIEVWDRTIRIVNLPVEYDSQYEVYLKGDLADIYGRGLKLDKTIYVDVPSAPAYASLPGSNGLRSLEAQFDPLLIYEYQNIHKGTFRINGETQDPGFKEAEPNAATYKLVDLSAFMNKAYGTVNLNWDFEQEYTNWKNEQKIRRIARDMDVQVTDLGISARYSWNKFLVWVNRLSTGEPAVGAEVQLRGLNGVFHKTVTNEQGFAEIPLQSGDLARHFYKSNRYQYEIHLSAVLNDDRVDLPMGNTQSVWRFGISGSSPIYAENRIPRVFFFSDRGLYKPGETVSLRGMDWNQYLGEFSPYEGSYKFTVQQVQGWDTKEIDSWSGVTSQSGGFFETWHIPEDLEPNQLRFVYEREGKTFTEEVKVAFFRRLNVQAELNAPEREFYVGDKISMALEASYLSGGALNGGEVSSFWTRKPVRFYPEGEQWSTWQVGPSVGWLQDNVISSEDLTLSPDGTASISQVSGNHSIEGMAYRYVAEATVEDIDRQAISVADSVIVHPATYYIAGRMGVDREGWWSRFVSLEEELEFHFAQVSPKGELQQFDGSVEIELIKGSWKAVQQNSVGGRISTRYDYVEESLHKEQTTWNQGEIHWTYLAQDAGNHRLRITGTDENDNLIVTDLEFYISGGSWVRWAGNNAEDITMESEKEIYFPGDTARILVKSPLEKGKYLLTIEREGILHEEILELDPSDPFIELEIQEDWVPIMYVTLTSFMGRTDQPSSYFEPDFGKPKGLFGAVALNISTKSRELDVEVLADKALYKPGEEGEIKVLVTQNGEPVPNAEVTYLAVDRGVLDLLNYHIPNPLKYFYSPWNFRLYGAGDDSRRLLLDPVTYDVSNLMGGDGDEGKLQRRDDFSPLAVFEPFLITDENGVATVFLEWPDTLTTYRSTVIALKDNRIGYGEEELFVRNPLNVRAAVPRRMRVRDTSFTGVVITNIDGVDHEVTVSAQSDFVGIAGDSTKTVMVPSGTSLEVPFVLEGREEGEGEILFTIISSVLSEELVQNMVVEKPLIIETVTTTGSLNREEDLGEEMLIIPSNIDDNFGSLSLSIDSSRAPFLRDQIQTLLDLRIYDNTYDYLYSAIPGIMAPEMVKAMGSQVETKAKENLIRFLKYLKGRQRADGSIAVSSMMMDYGGNPRLSLLSLHVLNILKMQNPQFGELLDEKKLTEYISDFSDDQWANLSYRLYFHYVQTLAGVIDEEKTDEFYAYEDELGISGYAMLAYIFQMEGREREVGEIYRRVKNFVSMGTRSVDIRETYESRDYFDSMYQQFSHLLRLGLMNSEESEILDRYTFSLNENKNQRNWMTPNDRMWMIFALNALLAEEKAEDTDFDAQIVLVDDTLMTTRFKGFSRGPDEKSFDLFEQITPISGINEGASLQFRKTGEGNLYYSASLQYALPNESAPLRDEGLSLITSIETLEGENVDESVLELGETYRMVVQIDSVKNRSFVNLSVPIPSGGEIVDPGFVTTSSYRNKRGTNSEEWTREGQYGDETSYIGEGYIIDGYIYPLEPNRLIYDNEIRYSWDYLYYGQREVSFLFRCTSPGVYPTPPASAHLLFEPEVFGRSRGRLIVIQ